MGKIFHFDIERTMQEYDLRNFVETGTGAGDSLGFILGLPFQKIWSSEIEPTVAQHVMNRMSDDRITLFVGPSAAMLANLWRIPQDERILFWLDAHFPGADYRIREWGSVKDDALRLPAKTELELIKQHRPLGQDVIILDDARIWLDDPFDEGILPEEVRPYVPSDRNIAFIHEMFDETHRIDVLMDHQGYIVLSPWWVADAMAVEVKHAR